MVNYSISFQLCDAKDCIRPANNYAVYFNVITIIGFCVLLSRSTDNKSGDDSNFNVKAICIP